MKQPTQYLWTISPSSQHYGDVDQMVVTAPTAEEARRIHPKYWIVWSEDQNCWIDRDDSDPVDSEWPDPSELTVTRIGIADDPNKKVVLVAWGS